MVEEFAHKMAQGDKRLLLVDGELQGIVRRVPARGEHRSQAHVGGRTEACAITDADHHMTTTLGPRLRQDGLFFAGLDVMGDWLIEINVTSPTLVRELNSGTWAAPTWHQLFWMTSSSEPASRSGTHFDMADCVAML